MNREIKFRVWDISKKVFIPNEVYGIITSDFKAFGIMIKDWENYKEGEYFYPKAQTLMQFTGIKDKNGVEIYEGDILTKLGHDYISPEYEAWQERNYEAPDVPEVEVKRDFCTLKTFGYWLNNESFGYEGEDLETPEHWTIIGNIYEHPSLIPSPTQNLK